MKTLDIALVRLLQFLVMLFFTFVVFLWYGCATLIPLAVWVNLTDAFATLFGDITATVIAFVLIGAIGFYMSKIPKLLETFMATGLDLVRLGSTSVRRLSDIAAAVKNDAPPQEKRVEIMLKDKLS